MFDQPVFKQLVAFELQFCALAGLILQALVSVNRVEQFGSSGIVIHPYFKLQWAILVAHDELIRELDIKGKFALGDDF